MPTPRTPALRPGSGTMIDFAKGVAIAMVVAYHATLYLQAVGVHAVLGRAFGVLALFPMPLFFLVTGLTSGRQGTWRFADLWRRRLLPLLYLYVLWSVIRTLFYLALPWLPDDLGEIPARSPLALGFLLTWPSSSYWFLYALVLYTLVSWLIHRVPAPLRIVAAAALSAAVTSGWLQSGNTGWDRTMSYFVFFEAAATFAPRLLPWFRTARLSWLVPAVLVLAVTSGLILFGRLRAVPGLVLLGAIAALVTGMLLSRVLSTLGPLAFVSALGRRSLPIYLLHLFFIVPATLLIGLAPAAHRAPLGIAVQVALAVVALVVAVLLARATSPLRWLYLPPKALLLRRRPPTGGTPNRPRRANPGAASPKEEGVRRCVA